MQLSVLKTRVRVDASEPRQLTLCGIEALERAARVPSTQLYRWPSLYSLGGEISHEEAYRVAMAHGPQGIYCSVPVVD